MVIGHSASHPFASAYSTSYGRGKDDPQIAQISQIPREGCLMGGHGQNVDEKVR